MRLSLLTVGREGLRRWLLAEGDTEALNRVLAGWDRGDRRTQLMLKTRTVLANLYASSRTPTDMRAKKKQLLADLRQSLCAIDGDCPSEEDASTPAPARRPLNNATLAAVATYSDLTPAFQELLAREDGDLTRFYERVAAIADLPAKERSERLTAIID